MGHLSILYGRIEGAKDASQTIDSPHHGALFAHNHRVLESIPDADDDYPFLTRHMFSLARPGLSFNFDRGIIRQIIHFGASLKVDHQDASYSDAWLRKFEAQLLVRLAWSTAVIHFEHAVLGERTVKYIATPTSLRAIREEFALIGAWCGQKMEWACEPGSFRG